MAEALEQKSTLGIKIETTYGVDPTLAAANVIEFTKDSAFPSYEPDIKERNVVKNSFSKMASVRGPELNAGGTIAVELHGSGTAGTAPESDPLWECSFGVKTLKTGDTTVSAATSATSFTLTAATGFAVGDAIVVVISGANEVTWITGLAGAVVTCSPALSTTPSVGAVVKNAGVHYTLSTAELKSFWSSLWLGDMVRRDFSGNKVSKLSMNFSTGEIISPKFEFMSKDTKSPVTEAYGLGTPSYDTADPLVATLMKVRVEGTTFDVSDLAFELDNTMVKRQAVTTQGITKVVRTGRMVSGSFSLLYENKDLEDAMRSDARKELVVVAGSALGNLFAVRIPKIRYTKTPVTVADGIYKYDVSFEAEPVSAAGEDEIYGVFF